MTGEKRSADYTADMVHSEKSIHLYAARQYDLFRKKQKYLTVRDRRKFCVIDVLRQYENLRLSQE